MTDKEKNALQKAIADCGGRKFEELATITSALAAKEYPNYGGDVPEGETLYFVRKFEVHKWTNREGTTSEILTAYLANSEGKLFEVAFSSFFGREWDFMCRVNGNEVAIEVSSAFPFTPKISERVRIISEIGEGTPFKVRHAFGHLANPYAKRIFNYQFTWVEKA